MSNGLSVVNPLSLLHWKVQKDSTCTLYVFSVSPFPRILIKLLLLICNDFHRNFANRVYKFWGKEWIPHDWKHCIVKETPKQCNAFDCGIFSLKVGKSYYNYYYWGNCNSQGSQWGLLAQITSHYAEVCIFCV